MTPPADRCTAVILFPDENDAGAQAPFQTLAGLPLLLRQLLWLREQGFAAVQVAAPPGRHAAIRERLAEWGQRRILPRVDLTADDTPGGGPAPGRVVLLDARFIHHPALLAYALSAEAPFVYVDEQGGHCGLGVVDRPTAISQLAWETQPRVRLPGECFAHTTTSPAQARAAEKRLYKSLIKPTDGWFSRNLDRPISLSITRRIIDLPIHPHPITVFALLVGIAAAWCAAQPGYGFLVAGGLLFLAASILDGVDGELARAKLLHSRTGEWLDTLGDDLTNFVYMAGITCGVYRRSADDFWLVLGASSLVIYALTLLLMYAKLVLGGRHGTLLEFQQEVRRPEYRTGPMRAWLVPLQPLIKRDFYAWGFLVCCLLDIPKFILSCWSVGILLLFAFIATERPGPFSGLGPGRLAFRWRRR
jgi:phosphatidylglycerophosphate synthase